MKTIGITFVLALALLTAGYTQQIDSVPLSVVGGGGYTVLDLEEETGLDKSDLDDWGQGYGHVNVAAVPLSIGPVRLGFQAGYNYFYWYEHWWMGYKLSHEYEAGFIGAVIERDFDFNLFARTEVNAYFFDSGTGMGVFLAAGYKLPLPAKLSVPMGLRFGIVNWDFLTPVSGFGGLEYELQL